MIRKSKKIFDQRMSYFEKSVLKFAKWKFLQFVWFKDLNTTKKNSIKKYYNKQISPVPKILSKTHFKPSVNAQITGKFPTYSLNISSQIQNTPIEIFENLSQG